MENTINASILASFYWSVHPRQAKQNKSSCLLYPFYLSLLFMTLFVVEIYILTAIKEKLSLILKIMMGI